jgi:uncharacterized protein YqiB (DUF1249 family)
MNIVKKYQPSLSGLMNLCDTNYMLLLKVLANKEQVGEQQCFLISDFLSYTLTIKEVTRYTSLIHIAQDSSRLFEHLDTKSKTKNKTKINVDLASLFRPSMVIRLYHDARMAEVISSQNVRQIKPRYDYPNADMHHPDEKQQINMFLKEWLQLCLQLGQIDLSLVDLRS